MAPSFDLDADSPTASMREDDHHLQHPDGDDGDDGDGGEQQQRQQPPDDCSICLDVMNRTDSIHPLQCNSTNCDFNMCYTCVGCLITSSKDDFCEASDGNMHVKVYLHCPNCRSDLGASIRETLLLRKADFLLLNPDLPDSDLNPSQLRLRRVLDDEDVKDAIVDARHREEEFFRSKNLRKSLAGGVAGGGVIEEEDEDCSYSTSSSSSSDESVDEWGVEVDLSRGVHQSFRAPVHVTPERLMDNRGRGGIDETLLAGFESFMKEEKKRKVTALMTSGDASSLAEAARVLDSCSRRHLRKSFVQKRNLRSSVFGLIDEAKKARPEDNNKRGNLVAELSPFAPLALPSRNGGRGGGGRGGGGCRAAPGGGMSRASIVRDRQNAQRKAEYLRSHPLPVRMPKFVEFSVDSSSSNFPLTFVDDTWDGTVADAYSMISITNLRGLVYKKEVSPSNRGVINVLSEGVDPDDASRIKDRIDVPRGRVLVASVRSEAGRKGVMKGDVVTHINGKEFGGTAEELAEAIRKCGDEEEDDMMSGGGRLTMVLNAERPIAEALRRRAKCAACWLA